MVLGWVWDSALPILTISKPEPVKVLAMVRAYPSRVVPFWISIFDLVFGGVWVTVVGAGSFVGLAFETGATVKMFSAISRSGVQSSLRGTRT